MLGIELYRVGMIQAIPLQVNRHFFDQIYSPPTPVPLRSRPYARFHACLARLRWALRRVPRVICLINEFWGSLHKLMEMEAGPRKSGNIRSGYPIELLSKRFFVEDMRP